MAEGDYVMIGLSAPPTAWSKEYRDLVLKIAQELLEREKQPFPTKLEFRILPPGVHGFDLAEGRSTEDPFGAKFYFKFTKPTHFEAKLDHFGSNSVMLLFMGEQGRLHWTRKDAKIGEPLTISCEITAADLKAIGDAHWMLKVTNFDRNNRASCVLNVDYDRDEPQQEEQD